MNQSESDESTIQRNAKETHKQMLIFVIAINLFCVFSSAVTLLKLRSTIIIIYISTIECFFTVQFCLQKGNKKAKLINVIESLLFNGNLLIIFIFVNNFSTKLTIVSSLQILCQIIVFIMALFQTQQNEQNIQPLPQEQIRSIIAAVIKLFLALQIFLIELKLSTIIMWSWTQVFSIFWLLQSLGLLFSVCLMIDLIKKCCEKQLDQADGDQQIIIKKGGMWLTMMMTGVSILPLASVSVHFLEQKQHRNIYNTVSFIFCFLFITIEIIYYLQNFNYLNKYFLYSEILQQQNKQQQITQSLNNSIQEVQKIHGRKFSIEQLPQILYRVSSTYYKKIVTHNRNFKSVNIPQNKINGYHKTTSCDEASLQKFEKQTSIFNSELKDSKEYYISSRGRTEMTEREILQQNQWMLEGKNDFKSKMQKKQSQNIAICLSCYDKQSSIVNMPCGHGGLCEECSQKLLEITQTCYLCRNNVEYIAKLQESNKNKDCAVQVFNILKMN